MAWYVYDVEFRRCASHNLSLKWGERDVQLYLDTFTGLPKSGCRSCGNTDHFSDACPLSTPRSRNAPSPADVCFNFNKGRPCARTPCPYKHRCNQPGCAATHCTQAKSILSSPATEKKGLNHLQALAVPPESTPEYLSHLTPPAPLTSLNWHSISRATPTRKLFTTYLTGSLKASK